MATALDPLLVGQVASHLRLTATNIRLLVRVAREGPAWRREEALDSLLTRADELGRIAESLARR